MTSFSQFEVGFCENKKIYVRCERLDGCLDGWMDVWMDGGWMEGCLDGWMIGWMDGRMFGWMDDWLDGWMVDGWSNRKMEICLDRKIHFVVLIATVVSSFVNDMN